MSTASSTSSTTSAGTTTNTGILSEIEAALSADAQKVVAFVEQVEQVFATFLTNVATGIPVVIDDIISVGQAINSKLSTITATLSAFSSVAAAVAPNDTAVQKMLSDLQTGAEDVAAVANSLTSGSTSGDNSLVSTAVTTIGAVSNLATLAGQAGAALASLANASPTATQVVSQTTPAED